MYTNTLNLLVVRCRNRTLFDDAIPNTWYFASNIIYGFSNDFTLHQTCGSAPDRFGYLDKSFRANHGSADALTVSYIGP